MTPFNVAGLPSGYFVKLIFGIANENYSHLWERVVVYIAMDV
jgi:hypothetical protein